MMCSVFSRNTVEPAPNSMLLRLLFKYADKVKEDFFVLFHTYKHHIMYIRKYRIVSEKKSITECTE